LGCTGRDDGSGHKLGEGAILVAEDDSLLAVDIEEAIISMVSGCMLWQIGFVLLGYHLRCSQAI